MGLKIEIKKEYIYILALIVLVGIVISYGTNNPSGFGHSASEIEGVCRSDGTGCPNLGANIYIVGENRADGRAYCRNANDQIVSCAGCKASDAAGVGKRAIWRMNVVDLNNEIDYCECFSTDPNEFGRITYDSEYTWVACLSK